jgi:protein-disulfide isomerase
METKTTPEAPIERQTPVDRHTPVDRRVPVLRPAPIGLDDHAIGPMDAPVTLLMYGNYECLHCRRAYPEVAALRAELGNKLRFVHRHFANTADFPHAALAAQAAEAAGAQGRFWDMHEALSLHARFLDASALLSEAGRLGLDVPRLAEDLRTHRYEDLVRQRMADAVTSGIRATPTFFVNGAHVAAPWDLDALGATLRSAAS